MNKISNILKLIVPIDHGNGNMKTAHCVFLSGVEYLSEEPTVSINFIKYKGKWYVIGESHVTYQGNKTESEDFYLLTLAAIAEELKYRNIKEAIVILAVGLPLAWAKTQAAAFRKYLMREEYVEFIYKKEKYKVHIAGVEIFPQGFAAICNRGNMAGMNMLVDIGNGTMDVMQIHDGKPIEKSIATDKFGVGYCMKEIQKELSKTTGESILEAMIEPFLRNGIDGRTDDIAMKVSAIATKYANEIMKRIVDYGYKEGLMHLYIVGGGVNLLKYYSDIENKPNVTLIDDICANAKGYEYLAKRKLNM